MHLDRRCHCPGRAQAVGLTASAWLIPLPAAHCMHQRRSNHEAIVVARSGYSPFANWEPESSSQATTSTDPYFSTNGQYSSNGNGQHDSSTNGHYSSNGQHGSEEEAYNPIVNPQLSWEDQIALDERLQKEREEAKKRAEEEQRYQRLKKRFRSSWDAQEAGGGRGNGADYLYEIGASSNQNTNVDAGQNFHMIDSLFTGNILGHKSDIADGSLRRWEFRSFNNLVGDYYVAPAFLEKITMHVVKNYLADLGCIDSHCKVPLILGVWGEKGMGKTFQTELALKKLGAEAVVMSAGELEHEWAGTPGRMIRDRYKKAGELSKVRGKFSVLLINDIDAGLGHFENTQVTVNNQIVIGTLMNLCDNPNKVNIGYEEGVFSSEHDHVRRSPIIVTGNDFSKMFAPLIRDGRMDKFYWKPSRDDLVNILFTLYADDGLSEDDMVALLERFPNQPLDFFGALRASTYDVQIRQWIETDVLGRKITAEDANMSALSRRLASKNNLPKFAAVELKLEDLIAEGRRLEREQEMVKSHNLANDYLKPSKNPNRFKGRGSLLGLKG